MCASGRRTGLSLSHARVLWPALGLWVYISVPAKRVRVNVGPCLQHLFLCWCSLSCSVPSKWTNTITNNISLCFRRGGRQPDNRQEFGGFFIRARTVRWLRCSGLSSAVCCVLTPHLVSNQKWKCSKKQLLVCSKLNWTEMNGGK